MIEFLRNLSGPEAESIAKLARFVINNVVCRNAREILEEEGIGVDALLAIQSLGIIEGVESVGLRMEWASEPGEHFRRALPSNGKALLVTHDDPDKLLELSAYKVSELGRQVMSLGSFEPHEAYLAKVAKVMCGLGFTVHIADILSEEGEDLRVGEQTAKCAPPNPPEIIDLLDSKPPTGS